MIDMTRCGAQETGRFLPSVMAQGDASTYETMIAENSPQAGRGGQTQTPQPNGAGQGETYGEMGMPGRFSAGQGGTNFGTALTPLPSGTPAVSAAEQILHSSWKSMMSRNLGRSVIVSFLIGTQGTIVARGILYEVGSDYIALYQPHAQSYISADLYSIRFMEFLPEGTETVG